MQKLKLFWKKEPVFLIALFCAIFSMIFVPPSQAYWGYIDFRVLELLFCLMAAVAGMQQEGVFLVLAQKILSGKKSLRLLILTLVMLPFFSSMLITNDVALITFVPFAVLVLELVGQQKHLAWVITLQTIGANIGSMLTPVGNPQNLYLSSFYRLTAGDFFSVTVPVVLLSLILLSICCISGKNQTIEVQFQRREEIRDKRQLSLFLLLFGLSLLSVFHLLNSPSSAFDYRDCFVYFFSEGTETGGLLAACNLCLLFYLCGKHRGIRTGKTIFRKDYAAKYSAVFDPLQSGNQQRSGCGVAFQLHTGRKRNAAWNKHRGTGYIGRFACKLNLL